MDCSEIVDAALSRLRSDFETSDADVMCRVLSPLERRDGDRFELVVRQIGDRFQVSDDGDTFDYLQLSGVKTRRNRALENLTSEVVTAHDVQLINGAIVVDSRQGDVGDAIFRVLAAMNDLSQFELNRRVIPPRTFDTLVEGELVGQGVSYQKRIQHQGEIRQRTFRFGINGQRHIVVEPLSARSASRAISLAAVPPGKGGVVWGRVPRRASLACVEDPRDDVWRERSLPDLRGSWVNVVQWAHRHEQLPSAFSEPLRGSDRFISPT